MSKDNKQRVTLLTRREKKAADLGGMLDDRIPEDAIRQRLANEGREFDTDAVLAELARQCAEIRFIGRIEASDLEPREVVEQAQETAAVVAELLERLQHMHPDLDCRASEILFSSRQIGVHQLAERIKPDLYLLQAALMLAAGKIAKRPTRTGPKRNQWTHSRDALAGTLRTHSAPAIPKKDSRTLAAELLELCGLPSPRKSR